MTISKTIFSTRAKHEREAAITAERIRRAVAMSLRRSNASRIVGSSKRFANRITDGARKVHVAEYSGRMLEAAPA